MRTAQVSVKDQEQATAHMRQLLDSHSKSLDTKLHTLAQASSDQLSAFAFKHESLEKTLSKLKCEHEVRFYSLS